jgi:ABC-2 type transport system permease protein
MARAMTDVASTSARGANPAWLVVADRELRDLWLAGRGLPLMLAYTGLLSLTSYLIATNEELNFLEQRESVSLTLQVAVAVGALLVLLGAADAVSGERERGTLETLLLSPAPRRGLIIGKGVGALSLWLGAFVLSVPYVWYIGRGVDVVGVALAVGLAIGTLLALFLVGAGLLISTLCDSNRLSLSVSLFALLALYAPTQMPSGARDGWVGNVLLRADPFTAGMRYLDQLIINGHGVRQDADWLLGPLVSAVVVPGAALAVASRLSPRLGNRS